MRAIALFLLAAILLASCTPGNTNENTEGDNMEIAVFETTLGNFEVELNRKAAPITVENFVGYVNDGFYNGLIFHRVIPNFMVQGGGFTPDGSQKATKAPIKLESGNGLSNRNGTVAMARTNVPDSATAQFFVNVVNNGFLDGTSPGKDGYAVFGKVISGMDTIEKIRRARTSARPMPDWPVEPVIIKKAYMKK